MTHGIIDNSYILASTFSPADSSYTYNFASSLPGYASGVNTGMSTSATSNISYSISASDFANITSTTESYVAAALTNMAGVGNVTFDYLSSSSADIVISGLNVQLWDSTDHGSIGGFAYGFISHQLSSDLFIPVSSLALDRVISHELGHSIGLKDAKATTLSGSAEDNFRYSMMSYQDHPGEERTSAELQLYDISSIQAMYGRTDHNGTNTTYSNFVDPSSQTRMFSIWDSGGTDTIDASGQATATLIDLRPGYFSSIGPNSEVNIDISDGIPSVINEGHMNVSIAYGAYIENAVGTAHDDLLIGNILSNNLSGGDGDDVLYAEGANSIYDAGSGDYRQISATTTSHLEAAPTAIADFVSDRSLQHDNLHGGDGDDLLFGGNGSDQLSGDDDDDTLKGSDGDDTLDGGSGSNVLDGGDGHDLVSYINHDEGVDVTLHSGSTAATTSTSDTITNIEGIIGSTHDDLIDTSLADLQTATIYGMDGADSLRGGTGSDDLYGGDGDDVLGSGTDGNDYLDGGAGADKFWLDVSPGYRSVTIASADEDDTIVWNQHTLTGGPIKILEQELVTPVDELGDPLLDENGNPYPDELQTTYTHVDNTTGAWFFLNESTDTLTISLVDHTTVTVLDFQQGDCGITLEEYDYDTTIDPDTGYPFEDQYELSPYCHDNVVTFVNTIFDGLIQSSMFNPGSAADPFA